MNEEQLFDWEVSEPKLTAVDAPVLVSRRPGWILVANRSGPQGFHVVKTTGTQGSLVTICGVTGRKVAEVQREIIECPSCAAALITP